MRNPIVIKVSHGASEKEFRVTESDVRARAKREKLPVRDKDLQPILARTAENLRAAIEEETESGLLDAIVDILDERKEADEADPHAKIVPSA